MNSKVSRRLQEATAPEVSESIYAPRLARDFPACFGSLCDINQAHLLMLLDQGLLAAPLGSVLAAALLRIEDEGPAAVPLDPALEDTYFNYEAHLMRVAGAHAGGALHVARSRNDILATIDRLRLRRAQQQLVEGLGAACATALGQALRHADVVMPGYTHLQPAQPVTFGFWLLAVVHALSRDIERLRNLQPQLDLCPLGAGALAGTSFAIDRARTAFLLGFDGVVPNALDAVASRDYALEFAAALAIMATGASRVAQDLHVWCSLEFSLVDFPDSVAGTSSMMPQKKNPVVLEYLKGKAGHLCGGLAGALATVKGVNYTHTGDGSRESMRGIYELVDESERIVRMLTLVLRTVMPNQALMLQRAARDFCTATDLADTLVRECGLSFRESHHVVGAVVRAALDQGLGADGISSAMVDAGAQAQLGRALSLPDQVVRTALDPQASVAARRVPGGPCPAMVRAECEALLAHCEQVRAENTARVLKFDSRREALKDEVRALAAGAR